MGILKVGRLEMASPVVVVVVVVARMECFWCGVNSFSIFFRLAHRRQTYCFEIVLFSDFNTGVLINDLCEILTCRRAFSY